MGKPRAPSSSAAPAASASAPKTVHSALVTYTSMLSLLSLCPPFVILLWYTMVHADGSVLRTYEYLREHGLLEGLKAIWPMPTMVAWKIIFGFGLFEAALQLLLPGKRFEGPVSPVGNVPVYKANGLQAYAVTLVTYLSLWWFGIFNPAIVYDHLGEIYSALVFGSFVFCIFLYIKGHVAPSSSDSGSSGNVIIDFYWGMELYPRIGKHFDIKVFTNCRFGMMSRAVLAVTYFIKQYEMNGQIADSMLVNTALMLIYVTTFFWWESGYWCTMDIVHDRAGFYICWGCLVWVPSIYTSPGMDLVNHPVNLGPQLALSILLAGILCIYINYDCDRQRQKFRQTNGKCSIWGKAPSKIVASYQTINGETKSSLLLTFGWWGLSRHFHYVPEILAAFFWTVPALFNHFLPYFYVVSRGSLKLAQKNYNHLNKEWEILLEVGSTVDRCPEENSSIPFQRCSFIPNKEMEDTQNNAIFDVIIVVISVKPCTTIQKKNGMETQKRTINSKDKSGRSVGVVLLLGDKQILVGAVM